MQLFAMLSNPELFFIVSGPPFESKNSGDDIAVVRLLDDDKDRKKMLTIKFHRKEGRLVLYESKITRNFFFSNENDREVAKFEDFETRRRMEDDYVGFWVQYKYDEGYGGQLRYRGVISWSLLCTVLSCQLKNMHGQKYFRSH